MPSERPVLLSSTPHQSPVATYAKSRSTQGLRHPFDSASGTIALGVVLTIVLVLALRLLNG